VGVCDTVPCKNDGTCLPIDDAPGYSCTCHNGYMGYDCEKGPCDKNPCIFSYQQKCEIADNLIGYECRCTDGRTGSQCEYSIFQSPCLKKPCKNGAKCLNSYETDNGYYCDCIGLWGGDNCDSPITTSPPDDLLLKSTHMGCYADFSDIKDLVLKVEYAGSVLRCLIQCKEENTIFAGLQNGGDCYCGNSYGIYRESKNCKIRCKKDQTFLCGGRNANNVWMLPNVWTKKNIFLKAKPLGCYNGLKSMIRQTFTDNNGLVVNFDSDTIQKCLNECHKKKYPFSALYSAPYGGYDVYTECYCGYNYGIDGEGQCSDKCSSDELQYCGWQRFANNAKPSTAFVRFNSEI